MALHFKVISRCISFPQIVSGYSARSSSGGGGSGGLRQILSDLSSARGNAQPLWLRPHQGSEADK